MEITADRVMELRRETGLPVNDCKCALSEANGDPGEAVLILRRRGAHIEESRAGRETTAGQVFSYVHQGKIGVLVVIRCETDFAARSEAFAELGRELCLQVAAMSPVWVCRDAVPEDVLALEREIMTAQTLSEGKPEKIVDRIVEGRMSKYFSEVCLLDQPSIRDPKVTTDQLVADAIGRIGERIVVERFVREAL